MVGISIARSTRSGTLVGPGIWRKCLPVCTVMERPSRDYLEARISSFNGLVPRPAGAVNAQEDALLSASQWQPGVQPPECHWSPRKAFQDASGTHKTRQPAA